MARIYTRTGDKGETSLLSGQRVKKSDWRVSVLGELDELNSSIGVALSFLSFEEVEGVLKRIQNELFNVGVEIATKDGEVKRPASPVTDESVKWLEEQIDKFTERLGPLKDFILPGGSQPSAFLHLARSICRRAERALVILAEKEQVREVLLKYLNRLSDLLFVMARLVNQELGFTQEIWRK
jgi:cob(I)alamin adenosyltransferase